MGLISTTAQFETIQDEVAYAVSEWEDEVKDVTT